MKKEELLDKCVEFSIKINKLRKYLRESSTNTIIPTKFSVLEQALERTIVKLVMR